MNNFEIKIQQNLRGQPTTKWRVIVQHTPPEGPRVDGQGWLELDLGALLAHSLEPRRYGEQLGKSLFTSALENLFTSARSKSSAPLHVLLHVEDKELRNLRWERLCAPIGSRWRPLRLNQRTPFSLYLPSGVDERFPPIQQSDLRALILAASPHNLKKYSLEDFDVVAAVGAAREALRDIPTDILAFDIPNTKGPPTMEALGKQLTTGHYTLLHLVCHGRPKGTSNEPVLYLATADNHAHPVTASEFIESLEGLDTTRGLPRLAFLAACDSADLDAEGYALGGLGQRLVRELGMPAVVAMTEKISVDTARDLSGTFYKYLFEHGLPDLALGQAAGSLPGRPDLMVPTLFTRLGGQPLFHIEIPDREARMVAEDIERGLSRLAAELKIRSPELLKIFTRPAQLLQDRTELEGVYDGQSAASRALAKIDLICYEALEMRFKSLALGNAPQPYDARCPFPGLYPFKPEDRDFFFGRGELIKSLLDRLENHPFLAILGPSGCGKSSLVLAGLVPEMEKDLLYLTPGADPSTRLQAALKAADADQLSADKTGGSLPAIIFVDQFEELFTHTVDEGERQAFIDRLLNLNNKFTIIITMRADFWGECAPYQDLKEAMLAHQELLAPMNADELRIAIEGQAGKVNLEFDAGLVVTILDEVRGEPGAMPLLQHTLLELWGRRHGRWLRVAEYAAIGGVKKSIAHTADNFYDKTLKKLYEGEHSFYQGLMREIFVRLTRLGEDVVLGGERRDTRRRVALSALVPHGSSQMQMHKLVDQLATRRLVVTSLDQVNQEEQVEVAHEALIRAWPKLHRWLEEDRIAIQWRDRVSREALEWEQRHNDPAYLLLRGRRLKDFDEQLNQSSLMLNTLETGYLAACRKADLQPAKTALRWQIQATIRFALKEVTALDIYLSESKGNAPFQSQIGDQMLRTQFSIDPQKLAQLDTDQAAYGRLLSEQLLASPALSNGSGTARGPQAVRSYLAQYIKDIKPRAGSNGQQPLRVQYWVDPLADRLHRVAWHALSIPQEILSGRQVIPSVHIESPRVRWRGLSQMDVGLAYIVRDAKFPEDSKLLSTRYSSFPAGQCQVYEIEKNQEAQSLFELLNGEGHDLLYLAQRISPSQDFIYPGRGSSGEEFFELLEMIPRPPRLVILEALPFSDTPMSPDEARLVLAAEARRLIQSGIPAVVTLPMGLVEETLSLFMPALLEALELHGEADRALEAARQASGGTPDGWQVALYTASENGKIYYRPGFLNIDSGPERRRMLYDQIGAGEMLPILGPQLDSSFFGTLQDLARRLADEFAIPLAASGTNDLPHVAQSIQRQDRRLFYRAFLKNLYLKILKRHRVSIPDELSHVRRPSNDELQKVLKLILAQSVPNDPGEVYRRLAELELPIYLTASPTSPIDSALTNAGRPPVVRYCPWNQQIPEENAVYDEEPSVDTPLVYHLFGHISEPDSLVLSENDYTEFLIGFTRNMDLIPTMIRRMLAIDLMMMVGFQIDTRNFQFLHRALDSLGMNRHRWRVSNLLQLEPDPVQHQAYIKRVDNEYGREGFDIFLGNPQEFIEALWEDLSQADRI